MKKIILLNYNTCAFTLKCIDSVMANLSNYPLELIVVDNQSRIEDFEQLKSCVPTECVLIRLQQHLGAGERNVFDSIVRLVDNSTKLLLAVSPEYDDYSAIISAMKAGIPVVAVNSEKNRRYCGTDSMYFPAYDEKILICQATKIINNVYLQLWMANLGKNFIESNRLK